MHAQHFNNYIRIFIYASLFWICLGILHVCSLSLEEPISSRWAYLSRARLLLFISAYFCWSAITVFFYYLIEVCPPSKNNFRWLLYLALTTCCWLIIITIINQSLGSFLWQKKPEPIVTMLTSMPPFMYLFNLIKVLLVYSLCTGIYLYLNMQETKLKLLELERNAAENFGKKTSLQLHALQSQLSPHFLFNCLNSISSLARTQDTVRITTAVANLAGLLRYTLESTHQTQVCLENEIEITKQYIELQENRFHGCFHFAIEVELSNSYMLCPPFCIQVLVENVFSHNDLNAANPVDIQVHIMQQADLLAITVKNTPVVANDYRGARIGLENLKERLHLLYGEQSTVNAGKVDNTFIAKIAFPIRYEHD